MAWIIVGAGLVIFLAGITGQGFLKARRRSRPDEKRAMRVVLLIASFVVGWWLVAIGVAKLIHTQGH